MGSHAVAVIGGVDDDGIVENAELF